MLITLTVFVLCSVQILIIKNTKHQRAITPTLCIIKLWFLCSALLLNKIYLPMKFHVDTTYSFRVMLRTKFRTDKRTNGQTDKQTDGRTDKAATICSPDPWSGSIKSYGPDKLCWKFDLYLTWGQRSRSNECHDGTRHTVLLSYIHIPNIIDLS